jgi:serine/threonine protein kinase
MGLDRSAGLVNEEDKDRLTQSGQAMGTLDSMAPEQALDTHHADARADINSLGCTLYLLLTGKPPYTDETLMNILVTHREAPIPSLCTAHPEMPAKLDAVFQKMVAKRPEDRYQSMAEVVADLEACVGKSALSRFGTSGGPGRWPWYRRWFSRGRPG